MTDRHTPGCYDGDVIFFRTARTSDGLIQPSVSAVWQPRVPGDIEIHDIDSTHLGMAAPAKLAAIGRVLRHNLDQENWHESARRIRGRVPGPA